MNEKNGGGGGNWSQTIPTPTTLGGGGEGDGVLNYPPHHQKWQLGLIIQKLQLEDRFQKI